MFKKYYGNLRITEDILEQKEAKYEAKDNSFVIAVMDRGWIFIGFLTNLKDGNIRLDNAYNVHRWGTQKGLGELALKGPSKETILFEAGVVYGKPVLLLEANIEKFT